MLRFIFDTINIKKHNTGIRTFQSLRGGYILLDYIWLDDKSPILEQLPRNFKSAAILLHPFVQMPLGWEKSVRKRPYEHIYPSAEEIIHNGKSVSWKEMMSCSGLHSYADLAMAMLTSISAFSEEYKREDLAEKLHSNLKKIFIIQQKIIRLYFYYTNYLNSSVLEVQEIYISLNQFLIQTDYYR
ncbi:putative protein YwbB [Bacillus thuringiensis serovar morrisoni str. 4AA1]|nr:hypothetical protein A3L20_11885 [Bacillus thuringiensis]EOO08002.1 hypothetical protein IAW_02760 [Bacillus cereus str. Schrouff]EOO85295.1 hypothetical protein IGY_03375 [Bacillus cereus K-5975c]UOC01184.1 putative protein YwbB [Bacillus thuringiensis serovar morrisoni str. 4AA1]SPT85112.1 Protein of uncharacterised function (DUF2711) [Bacillus cereus]